jgi:hypothetical protein
MNAPRSASIHATAIALAVDADGPLAGVLLLGSSGAGKSSLALAAIEGCSFRRTALIADDQVVIVAGGAASAPKALKGLIEVRGFGPAAIRSVPTAQLVAAFDLDLDATRVPALKTRNFGPGADLLVVPFRRIGPEAAAAHRLRVIVRQVLCGQISEDPQDARP